MVYYQPLRLWFNIDINDASSQVETTDKQDTNESFRIHGNPLVYISNDDDTDFDFKKVSFLAEKHWLIHL
ncbi:hypothetical protein VIBNISFn27_p10187 [Vibrio nigripulchritudo SFn27]|uniref:Uncharacterized protein n=1 Tax=Vibrio nigripulchritudo TaxID=28173 RepID=A0A9P1JLD3_9VIBR|nr:Protein of unknown function [Vibrio nigripulchritudo]CCN38723.1 hypothetical protein VIBNIAM115_p0136 [Vibrio nigripulchritudo AM115]CCN45030.1 hypothetical protein VIBNIFTn2_p0135 [Vibrio nigripulchritudo FTn2]CCN79789.1 hypothetical protein VIBNISO65_p0138 [Vibrio nigripulchritudo SO65]CCN92014.1 hypothetical protein VIBNISFn27_p10187 [Vibrio nigripulchritudo SFn27]CCO44048.1 hypothetical protein VIBNISFn135_p10187 [Vibrio nigripulchritudo SFn135]